MTDKVEILKLNLKLKFMTDKTPRINIPPDVKKHVFDRNGYQCQSCHKIDLTAKNLQIDHIIPKAKGGTDDISNLQTLCAKCNREKSAKNDSRFRRLYSD
jgi:5-methylcytosine-specific restriction endonuclease McrA